MGYHIVKCELMSKLYFKRLARLNVPPMIREFSHFGHKNNFRDFLHILTVIRERFSFFVQYKKTPSVSLRPESYTT